MEKLRKLKRKKKTSKVRGYLGAREFFGENERDVCVYIKELGIENR
jgi:hypothetical protein